MVHIWPQPKFLSCLAVKSDQEPCRFLTETRGAKGINRSWRYRDNFFARGLVLVFALTFTAPNLFTRVKIYGSYNTRVVRGPRACFNTSAAKKSVFCKMGFPYVGEGIDVPYVAWEWEYTFLKGPFLSPCRGVNSSDVVLRRGIPIRDDNNR